MEREGGGCVEEEGGEVLMTGVSVNSSSCIDC